MRDQLPSEQQEFLDRKLEKLSEIQPSILQLKRKLLAIDGLHLVAPQKADPDLDLLLERGEILTGHVVLEEMDRNSCHWNAAALWRNDRERIIAIGTGYALSDDGLWRQHSWCVTKEGMAETTELREMYFGICLEGSEAEHFSENYSD